MLISSVSTAVVEIDLAAVARNYRMAQQIVHGGCEIAAVVKSDAYGLGLVPIARTLAKAGCRTFFVADMTEAVALRAAEPTVTIYVLRDDIGGLSDIYRQKRLRPVVNNRQDFEHIRRHHKGRGFALTVDTGFSRFGLSWNEARRLFLEDAFLPDPPALLMSHLACAASGTNADNRRQHDRFLAFDEMVRPQARSLSASAGLWLPSAFHFELARCGSILYGINEAGIVPTPLAAVVGVRAQIIDERIVERGEIVGYAATFRSKRRMRIGIVGIGFAHGLPWLASNHIAFRLGAFSAPVVGRIAMEYTAVDLTEIPESLAHCGTWLDVLDGTFDLDALAATVGVNSQETLLRLATGCARHYIGRPSHSRHRSTAPAKATDALNGLDRHADR